MARTLRKDDSAVNILIEYILMLVISMTLFTILLLILHNTTATADKIVLTEECDILANDISNRISTFSSEVYLTDSTSTSVSTDIDNQVTYVDLPRLVQGKQYKVDITYNSGTHAGKVIVSYASDSTVYSVATFNSLVPVEAASFYSTADRYGLYYSGSNKVEMSPYT
jgi:hypothetical protein